MTPRGQVVGAECPLFLRKLFGSAVTAGVGRPHSKDPRADRTSWTTE